MYDLIDLYFALMKKTSRTWFIEYCRIFLVFDWYVRQRQEIVMENAVRSGAILSTLFPEKVKKQLMEDQQRKEMYPGNKRLKNFLSDAVEEADIIDNDDSDGAVFIGKPIAGK